MNIMKKKPEEKKAKTTKSKKETTKKTTTTKKATTRKKKEPVVQEPVKPFLSIVIPCYNCRNFIERLLDSIVNQTKKIPLEVIIQDDNSTDNFMELVEPYKTKLDIKYFKNEPRDIHCPGNTRLDGMKHISGEWLAFIDNDDMFELTMIEDFTQTIEDQKPDTLIVTEFREFNYDNGAYGKEYDRKNITWLHGKFYNVKFLRDNNITFKENLETNEDLYFNMNVFAAITMADKTYTMAKSYTYKWIYNEDSISRKMFREPEFYIDKSFKEYIDASIEPWWNVLKAHPEAEPYIFKRTCYVMLYAYFYYQSLYFRNKFKHYRPNRDAFEDFLNEVKTRFGATAMDIVAVVYSDDKVYNDIRADAMNGCKPFIESDSFYNFLEKF